MTAQAYEIVKYPNEVLRQKAAPILKSDKEAMFQLQFAKNYIQLEENKASGLALPQIGVSKRGFAAFFKDKANIVINPRVLKKSGLEYDSEGCLSVEEKFENKIPRPTLIVVQYTNHLWKPVSATLTDYDARVFMHELDHLNGVMFFDYIKEA